MHPGPQAGTALCLPREHPHLILRVTATARTAVIPLVGWRNLGRPFYGFTIPGTLYGHRLNRVDDDI